MKINNLSFRIPFIISITFILCMFVIVLIITVVSSKSIEDTAINRDTNNSGESTQKTLFRKLFDIWR